MENAIHTFLVSTKSLTFNTYKHFTYGNLIFLVVGDSGYGQQPWLYVPKLRERVLKVWVELTASEKRYNKSHRKTRSTVEGCIGVLKNRFRCLCRQRVLMYSPKTAGSIIVACVVLHNIMIDAKYPLPREEDIAEQISDDESENENEEYDALNVRNIGNAARIALIREHFQLSAYKTRQTLAQQFVK